ncbi:MAG TPA: NAD(P)/FAD-dependent oxidoreductase [Syntrophothermus lipocalidus]|nr:NAD(P)/FAD-dependent oxidoreductase [Syntrophothermus lipocalidus]
MTQDTVDVLVIGAGVVGLAVARELGLRYPGKTLAVVERNRTYGLEVSSRNSEVIHSGIYYPGDTLKTRLCLEGKNRLYEYCAERSIPCRCTGKLIIATDEAGLDKLNVLERQGKEYGILVERLTRERVAEMEPDISAVEALFVRDSGQVDVHRLMQSLFFEARQSGVDFVFDSEIQAVEYTGSLYKLHSNREVIQALSVVNCAGLGAEKVAQLLGLDTESCGYRLHPCKGEYFRIRKKLSVKHLIYPVPGINSLGIHLSFDMQDRIRLGPNAYYVDDIDYGVDEAHIDEFYDAAIAYLPFIQKRDLTPDFAGIRPKLQRPGESFRDFVIAQESSRRYPGWINLIGIESPGLTSSLAIAEYVAAMFN